MVCWTSLLAQSSSSAGAARPRLAHFMEHMVFKGTERRSAEAIAREMDSVGGMLERLHIQGTNLLQCQNS